ncbi:hypothetical protein KY320_03495 [Candidatus Woesearchaeota archaeon]|nr:hypothetical protein [Candidatus Woesearchaeota archaeon]
MAAKSKKSANKKRNRSVISRSKTNKTSHTGKSKAHKQSSKNKSKRLGLNESHLTIAAELIIVCTIMITILFFKGESQWRENGYGSEGVKNAIFEKTSSIVTENADTIDIYARECTEEDWASTLGECVDNMRTVTWIQEGECTAGVQHADSELVKCSC